MSDKLTHAKGCLYSQAFGTSCTCELAGAGEVRQETRCKCSLIAGNVVPNPECPVHVEVVDVSPEPSVNPEGDAAYWRARSETAELKVLTFTEEIAKLRDASPVPDPPSADDEKCDHGIPLSKAVSQKCQKCWDETLDGAMAQAERGAAAHIRAGAPFNPCPNIHQPCVICEALLARPAVPLGQSTPKLTQFRCDCGQLLLVDGVVIGKEHS